MKPKGTPKPYRSEGLFSRDYLNKILPDPKNPDWQVDEEEFREAYNQFTEIYSKWISLVKSREGDWRKDFINKVFEDILHFKSDTYSTDRATEKGEIPDYTFYLSYDDYKEAANASTASERFKKAIALGEAKQWKIDLDKSAPKQRSPVQQIVDYLNETKVKWGILTNGKLWRLYRLSQRGENSKAYYEFDLGEFLDFLDPSPQKKLPFKDQDISSKLRDFKYFYLFFRKRAFLGTPCFLDHVKNESDRQQLSLKDDLENNVYRAVRELAQGFVEQNHLDINDKELIKELWGNSLVFLYRLLFVLYAESYGHLPVADPESHYYKTYSLEYVKLQVEKEGYDSAEYPEDQHGLWDRLKHLFKLINEGSSEKDKSRGLSLTAYNGGLFDPNKKEHQFLEKYSVDNGTLAKVIDLLARGKDEITKQKQFLIYKDLGVTKLGGIYEGLLEHKFAVADDEHVYLVERKVHTKTRVLWVKESELTKSEEKKISGLERILSGELYLTIDKGERKGTGSYYTPDYIVRYIVDHTLGPLCDKAAEKVAELRPDIEKRIKKLKRDSKKKGEDQKKIEKAVEEIEFELVEPYLKLKVLDPAMGSGHFLVYATRYLGECIRDDENVAALIEDHADDELYWMRRVVERCIFGVDLNYLAVELAKLALWLETFSKDAPLSFLDHHLRQGNSLIGASVDQLGSLPAKEKRKAKMERKGQLGITSRDFRERLRRAVASYKNIEDMVTDHITKVTKKEKQLEIARNALLRFREIGDVWTSTYFGNEVEEKGYQALINAISSDKDWEKLKKTHWFDFADKQWHEANPKYFHWELEFPEVFFDKHGRPLANPGFDAVIGNPPYVRIQKLQETSPKDVNYYKKRYTAASEGNYDIYVVFVERGHSLLNETGRFGYILPHKFFNSQYGKPLRGYISKGKYLSHVVHFGHHQVFPEATSYTCLLFLRGDETKECHFVKVEDLGKWKSLGKASEGEITVEAITEDEWNFVVGKGSDFFYKLNQLPTKLGDVADIFVGLQTSADDVFIMDLVEELPSTLRLHSKALDVNLTFEKGLFFPLVSGTDVGRYDPLPARQYILFPYEVKEGTAKLIDFEVVTRHYPNVADYLIKNKTKLEEREGGKFKDNQWYRYGRSQNLGIQERVKLCVPRLVEYLFASYDSEGRHFLDNVDVGGISLKEEFGDHGLTYLLGLINSKLLRWYFPFVSAPFRGGWLSANRQFLSQLPIRTIDFSNPVDRKKHGEMVELVQNMLDAQKRKQEITQNYITWLESVIGAKVDDLTNKETIRDPVKLKNIDELIKLLIKNRSKLKGFDPKRLAAQQEITDDFNQCKAQIDSIAAEISKTDREIDKLVYKLYGLTEEEIEIVEGKGNPCKE